MDITKKSRVSLTICQFNGVVVAVVVVYSPLESMTCLCNTIRY